MYPEASGEEPVPKSNLYVFGSGEVDVRVAVGLGEGVLEEERASADSWLGAGVEVSMEEGVPIIGLGSEVGLLAAVGFPVVGLGTAVELKIAVGLLAVGLTGF